MIWVLAVIVGGLIVVLAELLLHYQKRAQNLRLKQDPIRRRIRQHTQAMREAAGRVQGVAANGVEELEIDLDGATRQIEELGHRLRAHERLIFGDGYDPRASKGTEPQENDSEPQEGEPKPIEKDPAEGLAEAARDQQNELEGHRMSLVRDLEVIKRTLGLLEAKLQRSPAAGGDGASGKGNG